MTITDILALRFRGDFASDAGTFALIDQFIMRQDVRIEDKVRALQHSSENGMGLPDRINAIDVLSYIALLSD